MNPVVLSDLQMAAALAESMYRRDARDQSLSESPDAFDGVAGSAIRIATQQMIDAWQATSGSPPGSFPVEDGFYYNAATGFVGQIVEANDRVFVVYRGSDLSGPFVDALIEMFSIPWWGTTQADPYDWQCNLHLGLGDAG
jgi:hypothetical protein